MTAGIPYHRVMVNGPPTPTPTHAPRARLSVRQFCTSAWSRLILRPLKPQNSVQPCPCHHTICDESWPVCAKPPLPAPVPHAADHTHTHTCSCPHLHPSRPSSAATFSPCPCFPSRPQPTTHSYALTSPYLPSPLPPFPLQATACKAPSFPVAFTLPTSTPSSRRHADPPFRPTKAPSPG